MPSSNSHRCCISSRRLLKDPRRLRLPSPESVPPVTDPRIKQRVVIRVEWHWLSGRRSAGAGRASGRTGSWRTRQRDRSSSMTKPKPWCHVRAVNAWIAMAGPELEDESIGIVRMLEPLPSTVRQSARHPAGSCDADTPPQIPTSAPERF